MSVDNVALLLLRPTNWLLEGCCCSTLLITCNCWLDIVLSQIGLHAGKLSPACCVLLIWLFLKFRGWLRAGCSCCAGAVCIIGWELIVPNKSCTLVCGIWKTQSQNQLLRRNFRDLPIIVSPKHTERARYVMTCLLLAWQLTECSENHFISTLQMKQAYDHTCAIVWC